VVREDIANNSGRLIRLHLYRGLAPVAVAAMVIGDAHEARLAEQRLEEHRAFDHMATLLERGPQ
jgi:hypothetical protein